MDENLSVISSGSASAAPDLDWSQVRETVKMLNLAVAQLNSSVITGEESVRSLTDSFTAMAQAVGEVQENINQSDGEQQTELLDDINEKCSQLSMNMHSAIIAFQFYDRLSQQLGHIGTNIVSLGNIVADPVRIYNPHEWHVLQHSIRSKYTMEEERKMFDMVINGASIEEALEACENVEEVEDDTGDIELF